MTEADIAELRSRIAEVDIEFGRRANILLDDILITTRKNAYSQHLYRSRRSHQGKPKGDS